MINKQNLLGLGGIVTIVFEDLTCGGVVPLEMVIGVVDGSIEGVVEADVNVEEGKATSVVDWLPDDVFDELSIVMECITFELVFLSELVGDIDIDAVEIPVFIVVDPIVFVAA